MRNAFAVSLRISFGFAELCRLNMFSLNDYVNELQLPCSVPIHTRLRFFRSPSCTVGCTDGGEVLKETFTVREERSTRGEA